MSPAEGGTSGQPRDGDAGKRIDLVFPRFKLLSGAERAILGLAKALAEAGHAPRIVCHQFDDSCRPRLAPDVELAVSGMRLDWTKNRYLNAVFDYSRTLRLADHLDPGADFRVFFGPALLLARRHLARNRRARIPSIYYCWEPPRVLYQDRREVLRRIGLLRLPMAAGLGLYAVVDRRMVRAVDAVVTSSPFAARRIEDIYRRSAGVITLGIDRERLDVASNGEPPVPPRLLTVNYLHPRKRVDLIVEAMAELDKRLGPAGRGVARADTEVTPAAENDPSGELTAERAPVVAKPILTVVGDGPERQRLEGLAQRLGIGHRVEFAGFVADEELPRYYGDASCYVHATRDESFGLSVIEAAYCRRPVVAVDEGGVRDTVEDGVTGYRVAATPAAIAEGVARVLASSDGGRGLGEAGHTKVAAEFRWDSGAADLLDVARSVEDGWSGSG